MISRWACAFAATRMVVPGWGDSPTEKQAYAHFAADHIETVLPAQINDTDGTALAADYWLMTNIATGVVTLSQAEIAAPPIGSRGLRLAFERYPKTQVHITIEDHANSLQLAVSSAAGMSTYDTLFVGTGDEMEIMSIGPGAFSLSGDANGEYWPLNVLRAQQGTTRRTHPRGTVVYAVLISDGVRYLTVLSAHDLPDYTQVLLGVTNQ